MPRQRPAEELKPRWVRLSDSQQSELQRRGHDALRAWLSTTEVVPVPRRLRDQSIALDPRPSDQVARAWGITKTRVNQIRNLYA